MKNKNLSFMTLLMLTTAIVGGCSCNKQDNENVSELVIKVGDKEYSADELYSELISNGTGASEAFNMVLRLVVESSMETSVNIQTAADLAVDSLEEQASKNATTNGTKKADELQKLIEEKGFSSAEEMKADIIYNQKLTRLTEQYWEQNKAKYYDAFVADRLPYLIRHVLVKVDDSTNANKIANNVAVGQNDAKELFDVIKRFENGDKFAYVANQESEDTGSTATGGAYYMDNTSGANGFVDEFVYGVYAFDTYTTKVVGDNGEISYKYESNADLTKLVGLSDTEAFATYYENGFNFVDMSVVDMLGEVYNKTSNSNKDYFTIAAYNKQETKNEDGVVTGTSYTTAGNNLNTTENYYARSIIFNRAFNKPGVSVIGYNTREEAAAKAENFVEYVDAKNHTKYILTDENKNPIFFVAARGSNNDLWVHFLTINVSALDDLANAKKFFTLTPDSSDEYTSYVELMNTAGTTKGANTAINTLEEYVRSYATKGVGNSTGNESLLTYDMVEYYMKENKITFANERLKNAINSYITNRRNLLSDNLLNSLVDDWNSHTGKLETSTSEFVVSGIKPYECAVLVNNGVAERNNPYEALSSSENLCRYVYGTDYENPGYYQVQLQYYYETSNFGTTDGDTYQKISDDTRYNAWFGEKSGYVDYVTIGADSSHIKLPKLTLKDGYGFFGWYTDKNLTKEVSKDINGEYYIDLSTSSMDNHTIFFAKILQEADTIFEYNYVDSDGNAVGSQVLEAITNSNVTSRRYNKEGTEADNTVTLTKDNFTSSNAGVSVLGFLVENTTQETQTIVLTPDDYGKTITITVVVGEAA